jgi:transcriptional regulator with XRE-family HTH domain
MGRRANEDRLEPAQVRAARAMLSWTQGELAERAQIERHTLAAYEKGMKVPYASTLQRLRRVLEDAGIEFIEQHGKVGALCDPRASHEKGSPK